MVSKRTMDQILMHNMKFFGFIGVLQEEKEKGQTFEIDLTLSVSHIRACDTDLISQTIDYGEVYQRLEKIMRQARFDLIERLAGYIADEMFSHYRLLEKITVTVRKPQAPIKGEFDYMGISICRERS